MIRGITIAALSAAASAQSASAQSVSPKRFETHAIFAVDHMSMSLTTAIATMEPSRMAPGHSWVRVYFYSFPADAEDVAQAMRGSVSSMDRKWESKSGNPKDYSTSRAVLQLTVDKDFQIRQVDMSVPGHTCTVASTAQELKDFSTTYTLDGKHLRLVAKGSFVCDMTSIGSGKATFRWNVDVDTPVFHKGS
jgi:hypothetical protein